MEASPLRDWTIRQFPSLTMSLDNFPFASSASPVALRDPRAFPLPTFVLVAVPNNLGPETVLEFLTGYFLAFLFECTPEAGSFSGTFTSSA